MEYQEILERVREDVKRIAAYPEKYGAFRAQRGRDAMRWQLTIYSYDSAALQYLYDSLTAHELRYIKEFVILSKPIEFVGELEVQQCPLVFGQANKLDTNFGLALKRSRTRKPDKGHNETTQAIGKQAGV